MDDTPSAGSCPVCRKPRVERYRPFCSRRCADVDLARWLGGRYAIPAAHGGDEDAGDVSPLQDGGEEAATPLPGRRDLN